MADELTTLPEIDETEIASIRKHRREYLEHHPEPKRISPTFWASLGLEAVFIALAAIAAVFVAGLRTYDAFSSMFVSANTPTFLTFVGSIAAMIAVEGLLMGMGLMQGKEKGTRLSGVGTATAFVISVAAGLVVSLGPIRTEVASLFNGASYVLSFSTALGSSILAYVGGLMSGNILHRWTLLQAKADEDYNERLTVWNKAASADYHRRGHKLIMTVDTGTKVEVPEEVDVKVTERVQEWLDSHGVSVFDIGTGTGHMFSPQSISEDLGLDDSGSVRTALSRMRKKAQTTTGVSNG